MADAGGAAAGSQGKLGGALGTSFRWFGKYFGYLIYGTFIGASFIIFGLLMLIGYNAYAFGTVDAGIVRTSVFLDQQGLTPIATVLRSVAQQTVSGELFFDESPVRSNIQKQRVIPRIAVSDMQIVNAPVYYGKKVLAVGTLNVENAPADLVISARCLMDKKAVNAVISGPGGVAQVFKGRSQTFSVSCGLPGVAAPQRSTIVTPGQESFTKEVMPLTAKELEMAATFSSFSEASLAVYVYNAQDYLDFVRDSTARSIFERERINDPNIDPVRGTVTSITTQGPVNVGIEAKSQPFVENTLNIGRISLSSNVVWASQNRGRMKKLESLELSVPDFIVLAGEPGVDAALAQELNQASCDFTFTGEWNERGEKIYRLNDEKLALTNRQCSPEEVESAGLSVAECRDLFGVDATSRNYFCGFALTKPFQKLRKAFIEARADYVYEVHDVKEVLVRQEPGKVEALGVA